MFKVSLSEAKAETTSIKTELDKIEVEKKNLLQAINSLQERLTNKEDLIMKLQRVAKGEDKHKSLKEKV